MKQYLEVLNEIITEGVEKKSARPNLPNTIGISHATIQMDMKDGFPLLTTKQMYWKGIVHELLWFLRGETNIKYLVDNKVNIWNDDAYRWYLKFAEDNGGSEQSPILKNNEDGTLSMFTQEEFVNKIISTPEADLPVYVFTEEYVKKHNGILSYKLGDLGKVYGYQWRNQNGVDQVAEVLKGLKENPYSRYHIIDGWNKADFSSMALPPCHLLYQFICRKPRIEVKSSKFKALINSFTKNVLGFDVFERKYVADNDAKFILDLNMYQRSVDSFLGLGFNIASVSLLLKMFAKACNMEEGKVNWIGGDTHLYVNHLEQAKLQLSRTPSKLPTLKINKELNNLEDILSLTINDFELIGYTPQEKIKAQLSTGLKK